MRLPRRRLDAPVVRIPRQQRRGADPVRVGAAVLAIAAIGTYLGFSKDIPLVGNRFEVRAVFEQANSIRKSSPVRIAGVNVGEVKSIEREPGSTVAVVTLDLEDSALPIHRDATLKIRPRIFLEGNFFVDLQPGTPSAPTIGDGDTIPITQTSTPVQLDQVLTALQTDSRQDLKDLLDGFGTALTYEPTAADDATQDPDVRGETAARSLNDALDYGGPAFRNTAIVNDALLGVEPHDLSKLVAGLRRVAAALDRNEAQLEDLVTNFNTTVAAFASAESSLRTSIRLLRPTIENASSALTHLNESFPSTRAFAREILPGVRETPDTIAASFPWIRQARALFGKDELRGLTAELRPTTAHVADLTDRTIELLPQVDLVDRCVTDIVLPTGDVVIQDPPLTSGAENYKEFWYTMVGLAGESQNFDGNGQYVRFQPGGGDQMVSSGTLAGRPADQSRLFGNAVAPPLGTRPKYPGKRPPYRPDVPCHTNKKPDLNSAQTGPPDGGSAGGRAARAAAAAAARRSRGGSAGTPSIAREIVARLNPWRSGAEAGVAP